MESEALIETPPVAADEAPPPVAKKKKTVLQDGELEKFVVEKVHRSAIKGAPYNPRRIDDDAKRKLKENLKRVGLLTPLVWNKRTGNLVSGHQRLDQMDQLMGTDDYHLTVAVVDLDEQTEKEQNIFFNNVHAMGDWDFEKLGEMFKGGIDAMNTGFDLGDVKDLFGGDSMNERDLSTLSDAVNKAHELAETSAAERNVEQDNNFFTIVVFKQDDYASEFNHWLGVPDERYIDARRFIRGIAEKIKEGRELPAFLYET